MSVFQLFNAYPVTAGNAILANWSFNASFVQDVSNNVSTPQFLYIYITDYNAVAAGNTIGSPLVVPLKDNNGNLTTSFRIDNDLEDLSITIQNGTQYHLMAQMVYMNNQNQNTMTSNSEQSIVMCSTIPQVPNFSLEPITDAFLIKLLNQDGSAATPVSAFDGYSVLKGIFVTYASGSQLFSKYIPNDSSNNLYSLPQKIDASLNTYEVSISSYNFNTASAPNGSNVQWGGRSATSASQLVVVDDTPGPVTDLQVYESMADFSNNMAQAATFTSVSNTITWNLPVVGASNETISSYTIYRNNSAIQTINSSNPVFLSRKYVDNSPNLVVGQTYVYNVTASNADGEGSRATPVEIVGVVFPTQQSLTVDPSGNQALSMKVTNVINGFPLNSYLFDFSYNGTFTGYQSDNPFLASGLTNNLLYSVQSSTLVRSLTNASIRYTTSYWTPVVQATPFNPDAPAPTDMSLNLLDASSNPTGTVALRWINSDVSNVGFTGQLSYALSYKLTGTPDASYIVQQNNINCLSAQASSYTMPSNLLTPGQSYTFRVVNTLTGNGGNVGKTAISAPLVGGPVVPFVAPGPVRNLTLSNPSVSDMSYSFLPPTDNGGLPLVRYIAELNLLNDGSNVQIGTTSLGLTDLSGNLVSRFGGVPLQPGSQYQLVVNAQVDGSVNVVGQSFNGPTQSTTNFTVPNGLNQPNVANAEDGALLNGIKVSWENNLQYIDLDASNATFTIYRNGNSVPIQTGVTGTSYLDTAPSVGSINRYQVVPVVNNVSGQFVAGSTPQPSALINRLALPNQPTNLVINSRTSSSVDFSWTASNGGSGNDASLNYLWELTDASGNVDASGVTVGLTASVTSLDVNGIYTISVRTGVVNGSDGQIYYNNNSPLTQQVALYNTPPQAGLVTVYGSSQAVAGNGALLVNVTDATSVSGLTFSAYRMQASTDPSFNNIVYNQTSTSSEFYISGLTNGTTYYVRAIDIYTDGLGNNVSSTASPSTSGVPVPAPNQPQGVQADTLSQNSVTITWNIDNSTTNPPNVYAINDSTDPSNIIQNNILFKPLSDFSFNSQTNQYFTTISGLAYGVKYYFNVIAGIESLSSIAVSQPSVVVNAVPYTIPTAPLNLSNIPGETSIESSWLAPSNTGGAGVGLNGQLLYNAQLALDPSFNNIIQDVSGISSTSNTFSDLNTNTTYNVRVRAYFAIQGNDANLAQGPFVSQLNIATQSPPTEPQINNVTADNNERAGGLQKGKTVIIDYSIDPTKASTVNIQRRILAPNGTTQLEGYSTIHTVNNGVNNAGSFQFIDDSSAGSVNFLNGNHMQYIVQVIYTIVGGSPYTTSTQPSNMVVPYSEPIPTDISGNPIDLSLCIVPIDPSGNGYQSFKLRINKNGSDLNTLVAVGLGTDDLAYVVTQLPPDISYNNIQVNGKIAANQYAEYVVNYVNSAGLPSSDYMFNTLAVISNRGGSLIAKQPQNGAFGPNQ